MKQNQTEELQPQEELVSLNDNLHSEYSVQELEQRLETDPLLLSALLSDEIVPLCGCKKQVCIGQIIICSETVKPCNCRTEIDPEIDVEV